MPAITAFILTATALGAATYATPVPSITESASYFPFQSTALSMVPNATYNDESIPAVSLSYPSAASGGGNGTAATSLPLLASASVTTTTPVISASDGLKTSSTPVSASSIASASASAHQSGYVSTGLPSTNPSIPSTKPTATATVNASGNALWSQGGPVYTDITSENVHDVAIGAAIAAVAWDDQSVLSDLFDASTGQDNNEVTITLPDPPAVIVRLSELVLGTSAPTSSASSPTSASSIATPLGAMGTNNSAASSVYWWPVALEHVLQAAISDEILDDSTPTEVSDNSTGTSTVSSTATSEFSAAYQTILTSESSPDTFIEAYDTSVSPETTPSSSETSGNLASATALGSPSPYASFLSSRNADNDQENDNDHDDDNDERDERHYHDTTLSTPAAALRRLTGRRVRITSRHRLRRLLAMITQAPGAITTSAGAKILKPSYTYAICATNESGTIVVYDPAGLESSFPLDTVLSDIENVAYFPKHGRYRWGHRQAERNLFTDLWHAWSGNDTTDTAAGPNAFNGTQDDDCDSAATYHAGSSEPHRGGHKEHRGKGGKHGHHHGSNITDDDCEDKAGGDNYTAGAYTDCEDTDDVYETGSDEEAASAYTNIPITSAYLVPSEASATTDNLTAPGSVTTTDTAAGSAATTTATATQDWLSWF